MSRRSMLNVMGVIPARLDSQRLKGKLLMPLGLSGSSVLQRTLEALKRSNVDEVYVATPDQKIVDHVTNIEDSNNSTGVRTLGISHKTNINTYDMAPKNGTERVGRMFFGPQQVADPNQYDVIVIVQGDQPMMRPEWINQIVEMFHNHQVQAATLFRMGACNPLQSNAYCGLAYSMAGPTHINRFSRTQLIAGAVLPVHVGVYAYTPMALKTYLLTSQTNEELDTDLEQVRLFQTKYSWHASAVSDPIGHYGQWYPSSIDTILDIEAMDRYLEKMMIV